MCRIVERSTPAASESAERAAGHDDMIEDLAQLLSIQHVTVEYRVETGVTIG